MPDFLPDGKTLESIWSYRKDENYRNNAPRFRTAPWYGGAGAGFGNGQLKPLRGAFFGLRPFITTGGMGVSTPIIISFEFFPWEP